MVKDDAQVPFGSTATTGRSTPVPPPGCYRSFPRDVNPTLYGCMAPSLIESISQSPGIWSLPQQMRISRLAYASSKAPERAKRIPRPWPFPTNKKFNLTSRPTMTGRGLGQDGVFCVIKSMRPNYLYDVNWGVSIPLRTELWPPKPEPPNHLWGERLELRLVLSLSTSVHADSAEPAMWVFIDQLSLFRNRSACCESIPDL